MSELDRRNFNRRTGIAVAAGVRSDVDRFRLASNTSYTDVLLQFPQEVSP